MARLLSLQPFRILYLIFMIPIEFFFFLGYILACIFPQARPNPQWTFRQAVRMRLLSRVLHYISTMEYKPKLSLKPKSEGSRFIVAFPSSPDLYRGPMADAEIKPEATGITWTPASPTPKEGQVDKPIIVLHFHGGAYVIGDGRDADIGFLARTLVKHMPCTHVATPQYRLARESSGRFPAALQDALTSYLYLTRSLGLSPSSIIVSGDSAGGNLALALLRYIGEHGRALDIAWPRAVLLWSPWVDIVPALDTQNILGSRNYRTDYLGPGLGKWGAEGLTGSGQVAATNEYVSPLHHPFWIESPVWVHTGSNEVLCDDNKKLVEQLRDKDVAVELFEAPGCPHDILLMGPRIGFQREAIAGAKQAGLFLDCC